MADNTPIEAPQEPVSAQVHNDLQHRYDSTRRRLATLVENNRQLRADLDAAARNNRRMVDILNLTREEITSLKDSIADNAQPPFSFGTVLEVHAGREHDPEVELPAVARPSADILYSGRKMRTHISPLLTPTSVTPGSEVLLDEGLSIVAVLGTSPTGETGRVKEVLEDHRLVIVGRSDDEHVVKRAGELKDQRIRIGDAVLVDYRSGYATQVLDISDVQDVMLEEVPDATFDDIGGLGKQIEQIRDSVELPFLYPELYQEHHLQPPKGILLYGPPGTGKTLIAKAVAQSLAERADGVDHSYFLNIKGPELLNKYVGETERHIRTIFSRAREKASDGYPVVIFFDEMESLFRTRGSGTSSDVETTIVPQLLAEIDGVEALQNVIVIGASNREDMIDPAILRPGRLDVKIRVDRPDAHGAREIFRIYLRTDVPIHPEEIVSHGQVVTAIDHMIEESVEALYARNSTNEFVEVTYLDGSTEILYFADFVSGATIANIVDRAKRLAIKDYLSAAQTDHHASKGIRTGHLVQAIREEKAQQLDLPDTSAPQQWLRLAGHRGAQAASLRVLQSGQDR
ncbi:proteasome ATPase [Enteractinococcus coprophilus]|uniref:AAA ATPase forming ring-shaped complexes n=1 Tax=Enteractinococcus coprophilus TaxID=1027633 RepID=A0A543AJH5_9MICC|nr:proteasome ATPase [Enteractinococcus coprophilus]TQL72676.1 proteasome-associated ATPase [Enteractinococcus coprophilus]